LKTAISVSVLLNNIFHSIFFAPLRPTGNSIFRVPLYLRIHGEDEVEERFGKIVDEDRVIEKREGARIRAIILGAFSRYQDKNTPERTWGSSR
jgi:hypothetical protein